MPRDTILFDINETVLELATLRPKFQDVFDDKGVAATWFSMLLHTSTICALTSVKTEFSELAGITLDTLAARHGVNITAKQRGDILDAFANLKPHDDVIPALKKLRGAGYRTVAFTNSSLKLATSQIANAGLTDYYNMIVSVEKTGSFKPDARVYKFVAEKLERNMCDLRLIAAHDWDTHGAITAGLMAAYIDRTNRIPYNPLYRRPSVCGCTMDEIVANIFADDGVTSINL